MGDGIEDFAAERQRVTGGLHYAAAIRDPVFECSLLGYAKTLCRLIDKHHSTPCYFGEMQTRPTTSSTQVQQGNARPQLHTRGEFGGLVESGVAVCPVI